MPNTRAKGGNAMTIAEIVEHWLAGGSVPPPSEQPPDNVAVVHVADFVDYYSDLHGQSIALVNREEIDDEVVRRHSVELWWDIPLDKVADWVNGTPPGEDFDVHARRGTLRLHRFSLPELSELQIARFYVSRRDAGREVAYADIVPSRGHGCFDADDTDLGCDLVYYLDTDVAEALEPFRDEARVVFVTGPWFVRDPATLKESVKPCKRPTADSAPPDQAGKEE
jgi:hypothetical protein